MYCHCSGVTCILFRMSTVLTNKGSTKTGGRPVQTFQSGRDSTKNAPKQINRGRVHVILDFIEHVLYIHPLGSE